MAASEQPLPKAGRRDVFPALIADLKSREAKGIETYGTTLQTHNGRNSLLDAYQEVLDLAVYLKQKLLEEEDWIVVPTGVDPGEVLGCR